MIPFSRQKILSSDIKSVIDVLKSDFLTKGPKVQIFEKMLSKITHAKYVMACNSGSSALHLACMALDVKRRHCLD